MLSIFICTDDTTAKEVAVKYLDKDKMPFVTMLHDLTYEQATEIIKTTTETKWLIWSDEHSAWWAPGERGYTRKRSEAGRYPYNRALEIVKRANCRNGDRPFEAMVEDVDDDEVAKIMGRA